MGPGRGPACRETGVKGRGYGSSLKVLVCRYAGYPVNKLRDSIQNGLQDFYSVSSSASPTRLRVRPQLPSVPAAVSAVRATPTRALAARPRRAAPRLAAPPCGPSGRAGHCAHGGARHVPPGRRRRRRPRRLASDAQGGAVSTALGGTRRVRALSCSFSEAANPCLPASIRRLVRPRPARPCWPRRRAGRRSTSPVEIPA